VALASDIDPNCAVSYRANFPGTPFHAESVTTLTSDVIAKATRGAGSRGIALLAGGPPCPPFSKSRFYRKEKPRALGDPVGNETMTGYLRILEELNPKAFLLENVPGLAFKVHEDALKLILETAKRLGYQCKWNILNAADYGVPQIRERFILVGMKDRLFEFPQPTNGKRIEGDLFSRALKPWKTAGDAIGDLDSNENADDTGHFAGGKHHDLLREIPPGDNYLFFTKERGHAKPLFKWRSRYWSFLLKLSPKLPAWTIQARRSNNMGPLHWRNRILRIEEVKRLQTFPDDWKLAGTIEHQWRQIGNAVPPLLAEQLGHAIASQLSFKRARKVAHAGK
jgi:DNA (cytosine-5)-methyltransferase 1